MFSITKSKVKFSAIAGGAFLLIGLSLAQKSQNGSPDGVWEKEDIVFKKAAGDPTHPVFRVDWTALEQRLQKAPTENFTRTQETVSLTLPMPDGSYESYDLVESPIMAPELAAKFPEIKTYCGTGTGKNRGASVRISVTPDGVHAQVLGITGGTVYLDPMGKDSADLCVAYRKADAIAPTDHAHCLVGEGSKQRSIAPFIKGAEVSEATASRPFSGTELRTYRLAVAATGEYTAFHGGTVSSAMAAIVTAIDRVTGVYETELSIRFELVANNDLLIYTNSGTDPYTNDDGLTLLGENQANVDAVIGNGNYDIGHVFSTGGGGIASLGSVGRTGSKARGVTGLPQPIGDPFFIDFVSHEIGHQFRGNHTFNGDSDNCAGGNRNGPTAFEPGSGNTIQAYAGICGNDNLQNRSDPYFHSESFDEMTDFVDLTIPDVGTRTATGNNPPQVEAGASFIIPARTPFELTASATDPDGDALTYCWEERDLGAQQDVSAGDNGSSPIFRSFSPTTDPTRTFPRLTDLLTNTTVIGETLPTTTRTLNFRVTARDNRPSGGGVRWDDTSVSVIDTGQPFRVTAPNTAVTWSSGAQEIVSWDVAGTTANGINAASVDITLSTDGGLTYPITLASAVPNDGNQEVTVPIGNETSTARIRVQATGGIFFDVSNSNFNIENTNGFSLTVAPPSREACDTIVATYQISSPNFSDAAITLNATNLPPSATAEISPNPLPPGGTATLTVTTFPNTPAGDYDVTVTGSAAGSSGGQSIANILIFTEPPSSPSLTFPADGATGISLEPTFSWASSSSATNYTLELSEEDPTFAAPLILPVGEANSISFFLAPSVTTYWRVGATNACGTTLSAARSFTTAAAFSGTEICSTNSSVIPIPDNDANGVEDQITINGSATISDLDVSLNITHTWVGDLNAVLTHQETGTSVSLLFRLGNGNCSGQNMDITFSDEAPVSAANSCTDSTPALAPGSYSPDSALSIFDGEDISGTWSLKISDEAGIDTGTLNSWCLLPTTEATTTPYEDWLAVNFTTAQLADSDISGPGADPDADGRDNLAEYHFGQAPLLDDFSGDDVSVVSAPDGTPSAIRYQTSAARYDATVSPEASSDLTGWDALPRSVIATDGPLLTIETPLPETASERRFLRLSISIPD